MDNLRTRWDKGFTLFELLLVVAMIGSLFVFLLPRFLDFNERELARSEARTLADGLKKAVSFATAGVQTELQHALFYRFSLYHDDQDPAGVYRGYTISSLDSSGSVVAEQIEQKVFSCQVCVTADDASVNFRVPSGSIEGASSAPITYSVCYPEQGTYSVTLEVGGGVTLEGFSANACACNLLSC